MNDARALAQHESIADLQRLARQHASTLARRMAQDATEHWKDVPLAVVGAWSICGHPLYAYPEIAGYWLQWASARTDIDDCALVGILRWLQSVQNRNGLWPTRIGLAQPVQSDYQKHQFLFDHAILRRGVASVLQARGIAFAQELLQSLDGGFGAWQLQGRFQACIPETTPGEQRWSQHSGPFLLKARAATQALTPWCDALARDCPASAAISHPHPQTHPQLYAVEGLIGLGDMVRAKIAWGKLKSQVDDQGLLSESVEGRGPLRSDILAQALRVAIILEGFTAVCAAQKLRRMCLQLVSRIEGERMPFVPGGTPIAWAAIFANQALNAFAQGGWFEHEVII